MTSFATSDKSKYSAAVDEKVTNFYQTWIFMQYELQKEMTIHSNTTFQCPGDAPYKKYL
jgi:hypothetical protein